MKIPLPRYDQDIVIAPTSIVEITITSTSTSTNTNTSTSTSTSTICNQHQHSNSEFAVLESPTIIPNISNNPKPHLQIQSTDKSIILPDPYQAHRYQAHGNHTHLEDIASTPLGRRIALEQKKEVRQTEIHAANTTNTMNQILTSRQAEELWVNFYQDVHAIHTDAGDRHKSIIAYLTSQGLSNSAAALREELNIGDSFDAATSKKYEGLLEKKWTSVVRLQKKVGDS